MVTSDLPKNTKDIFFFLSEIKQFQEVFFNKFLFEKRQRDQFLDFFLFFEKILLLKKEQYVEFIGDSEADCILLFINEILCELRTYCLINNISFFKNIDLKKDE